MNENESTPRPRTRVTEQELGSAKDFLKNDPRGKRLQAAEHALILLIKGELPRLKRFIFNASFDLRRVVNERAFEKAINGNPKWAELLKQSKTGAYTKVNFEKDNVEFVLFFEKGITRNEAALYSDSFGRVIAATYASLGLDMSGFTGRVVAEGIEITKDLKDISED